MSEDQSSENAPSQSQNGLPLQQRVGSENGATALVTTASASSHMASPRYVEQFRVVMDNQRKVFHDERDLWHIERAELQEKITRLEASVHRYRAMSSSQVSSPPETNGLGLSRPLRGEDTERLKRVGTGDEFWRGSGGKEDARPTRTFPNSYDKSFKVQDRLTKVVRDPISHKTKATSFSINSIDSGPLRKANIRGIEVDKNLDGITFRKSSLALTMAESLVTLPSPPPPRSASPTQKLPVSLSVPSLLLTPCDPYTKDAGHTPLARRFVHNQDENSIATSSDLATPTQPEIELAPLVPRTSVMKVPSESANSYFPNTEETTDEDAELCEPLGLKNNGVHDRKFLNELDSKLLEAARLEMGSPELSKLGKENVEEEKGFDQPDLEPKLRIKRSMNFGSQLGAARLGKGF